MSGMFLHGLGDCTPALHCGCLDGVAAEEYQAAIEAAVQP